MEKLKVALPKNPRKFHTKQSAHEHMPEVPFRMIALGNSGSGKTLTLQNMILNHYRELIINWIPVYVHFTCAYVYVRISYVLLDMCDAYVR